MADDISDRKSPGFWFFTADFERDMQILPLAAQGLWIRMMCWASDNEAHRGFLELPTGEPMTDLDIAHRVGKPIKEVRAAIDAMRRLGTFSEDSRGCIFSRRMARDTHISEVRRQAAIRRAETARRAADGSFSSTPTSSRENEKSPRSEVAPQGETGTECPSESSKPNEFAPANNPANPQQNPTVPDPASGSGSVSVKPATTTHGEFPETAHAIREGFPESGDPFIMQLTIAVGQKVAGLNGGVKGAPTDALIAEAVRHCRKTNPKQTSAGLYLRTVPQCVATWLTQGKPAAPDQPEYYNLRKEREQEAERRRKIEEQGYVPIRSQN